MAELLGSIHDITLRQGETEKIKIRTVNENNVVVDKLEIIVNEDGSLLVQ